MVFIVVRIVELTVCLQSRKNYLKRINVQTGRTSVFNLDH